MGAVADGKEIERWVYGRRKDERKATRDGARVTVEVGGSENREKERELEGTGRDNDFALAWRVLFACVGECMSERLKLSDGPVGEEEKGGWWW